MYDDRYEIRPNTFLDAERARREPCAVVVWTGTEWDLCCTFPTEAECRIFIRGAHCAERMTNAKRAIAEWERDG